MNRSPIRLARNLIVFSVALIGIIYCLIVLPGSRRIAASSADETRSVSAIADQQVPASLLMNASDGKRIGLTDSPVARDYARRGVLLPALRARAAASPFSPFAPTITAQKTFMPAGNPNPGDTITWSIVISNTGNMDATGVTLNDVLDSNTTLVPGSVIASPIALNDTYNTIGNVPFSTNAAQGVIANDLNPNGSGTLTVTQINATALSGGTATVSTSGGSVTINSNGSFTYTPNAGFRGPTDSFTYTLDNTTGKTDTATVTININGLVWFVNNDPAAPGSAPGDGRLTNPFRAFGGTNSFNTIATDAANDVIFVYTGTAAYTGGVTLLAGQKLVGQGAGDTLLNIGGLTAPSGTVVAPGLPTTGGTNPTISAAAANITLGSNNTIRGVTLNGTAAAASNLTGTNFGTLTLAETTISGTGQALNLTTGTLSGPVASTAAFTSISSTGSSTTGISLTSVAGAMSSGATTISTSTGIGISVNTSSAALSFNNTTGVTNTGGTAISLTTNTGTITFSTLNITNTTSNQQGLLATDNTNTITVGTGTINTGTGGAINITKSSGTTPLSISLVSVSSSGGSANGIILSGTSGSFTVVGDGTNTTQGGNGTGGTIGGKTGANGSTTQGTGIFLNNAQNVTLRRMTLNGTKQNNGIRGATVTNFTLQYATVNGTNGDSNAGGGEEGSVRFDNLTGSALIDNCNISGGGTFNLFVLNTTNGSSLNRLMVTNNAFGLISASIGNDNVDVTARPVSPNTATLNVTFQNNTLAGTRGDFFEATADGNSTMDAVVRQNKFTDGQAIIPGGGTGVSLRGDSAGTADTMTFDVSCNRLNGGDANAYDTVGMFIAKGNGNGTWSGAVVNNIIGPARAAPPANADGLFVRTAGGGSMTILVQNNNISGYGNDGMHFQNNDGSCTLNATIFGNVLSAFNSQNFAALFVDNGATATDTSTTNVVIGSAGTAAQQNTLQGAGKVIDVSLSNFNASTHFNLSRNGSAAGTVTGVIQDDNVGNPTVDTSGGSGPITLVNTLPNAPATPATCTAPSSLITAESVGAEQEFAMTKAGGGDQAVDILSAARGRNIEDKHISKLTQAELNWLVQAALERWRQLGISADDMARLQALTFEVASLPEAQLATASSSHVKIDETGAGFGWYFDPTPNDDVEFDVPVDSRELQATELSPAHGRMDLLTVIMRELGTAYMQGRDRTPKKLRSLMQPTLLPSVRRMPIFNTISLAVPGTGQSLVGKAVAPAPAQPESDYSTLPGALRPAVFTPDAEWMTGSYGSSAKPMSYSSRARRAAYSPFAGETINKSLGTIPAGKSVTVMFQATIAALNALPVGTTKVCNQGTISGSNFSSVQTDDPGTAAAFDSTCATLNVADLAVTKTDSPDPVIAGNNITYTINFVNNGPAAAQTVTVTDAIPANTTFVSATVTTGSGWGTAAPAVGGTGNVVFSKASVANGETAVFTIVVKVTDTTAHNTVITNSVTAASTTGDTTPANNTASTTTTVTGKADLTLSKSAPATVIAGNDLTYTLNFSNAGPGTAVNVNVTDAVPTGTTFVSATVTTGTGWTVTAPAVGGTGNVVFSKASVPSGETAVFSIVVNVPGNTTGGTIIHNSATATADTSDPTPATATADTTVIAQADLAVTKTDSPDPVIAGNNLTYTINFVNNGPGTAISTTVTDAVPANTTFVSATVTTGTGWTTTAPAVGGTGNVVFSKASVPNGETAVFTIVVKVNASAADGSTITNSVTAASTTNDPDNTNNTATATTTVQTQADLSVTKTDSPDPVIAGNNLTYTINFSNGGPSDAQTVTVTDAVPANTTFVSATVTTGTGWTTTAPAVGGTGNVVFSKATVTASETAVFTIVVHVNSSTADGVSISNSATAATTTTDPTSGNNTSTATTLVQARADLVVTKTDSPDPVAAGNNLTYTINFMNAGPSDASNVTVTDAVPANTTFVSATVTTGTGWTTTAPAVGGTGNVVFSKAVVVAGESAVFTIVVHVNSNTANGATITNSATAATTTTDPVPANNTGTATTTVNTSADLAVTKSDSPDPAFAGNNITYTINFVNNGPSDAASVTVTDAIPANTTFVSATVTTGTGWTTTAPAVGGTGNVVFSKDPVAAGETAVFTIIVKVDPATTVGTIITNSATAASTTSDPTPGNNTGTATTTIQAQADLALTKTGSPTPDVIAGNNITYTINLVNNGPGAATNVTVTDAVPANTTFVSATVTTGTGWSTTAPAVGGTGNVVFSKASVANGETAVFTIVVKVNSSTPNNTTITNSATAASTTADPTPGNNTDAAMTNVITRADLSVTKTDSPDPVIAGNNLTYTINFANNGPSDAASVTVTDAVPANTTFVSATVTTGTGWTTTAPAVGGTGNVVFSKDPVTAGETAVFTIVVHVNSNTVNGATISNSVTAATTTTDPTSGNDTATATTTVQTQADLVVTKTDSPDPVSAGSNLTYTINFSNAGPSDAQAVTVTDAVPANTTFVSAVVTTGTGWSVNTAGPIVFSKATVAAGESAVFTMVVKVNSNTADGATITNSATAASTTTDPTPGNNTGTATTTVQTRADLAVTKSDSPDPAFAGTDITYTINFVNNGPSDAQTVTVTDAVPANTTFVSATVTTGTGWTTTAPAVGGTGNVVFSKATVTAGETAVFTIVVKVDATTATGTTITNTVTAATTTTDPDSTNNTATATTEIQAQADLSLTKTASPTPNVIAGNNVTYTINFANNGPGAATSVTVTDAVPANTTFVSATVTTGTGWTTTAPAVGGTGNVVFSKATVAVNETAVFTIVVKVNSSTPNNTTITNSATAASTTADPTPGNNTDAAMVTAIRRIDLAVTKSDAPDPVIAGNNITYTINFANNGPSDASNVTVTDAVPANTTFVSATVTTGTGWSTSSPAVGGTGNVVFSKAAVTAGESAVFTIVVHVNSNTVNGATISNSVTAAATETDTDNTNNTASATTSVITRADLVVTKTDSPDPVIAGNNLTYTINFSNAGPSDAQSVTVTDAIPANTTFVSATVTTGSGWSTTAPAVGGTGNVVFSKATVVGGESAVFTIVVKVNSNAADGSTITNSATAATTTTDPTPGNNTGTASTTVQTQADLAVTKSDSPDPAFAGTNITYTINFVNNGPSDAQSVTVTDAVPANTTFVSATVTTGTGWTTTAPAVGGTGNVVFSKATVTAGETAVFTIVVKINANTPTGTTITNSVTAATATTDPTSGNDTATATTTVQTQADLAVTKTDSPDPVIAGNNLTYTINLVNNGPSDAQTVTVTDAVPANTTFVSATVTTGSGWSTTAPAVGGTGNVVFSKATVVNGETAVFTIVVKVNANTANGTTITNSAVVAAATGDGATGNNTATATTTVQTQADLAVTKTDSPDPVIAGNNLTYTINLINNGPSDAQSVTVTDAVPANTTFVSAVVTTGTGWSVNTAGPIVFSKATVAAGESAVFTMVVKVNSNAANNSTITNSATAASTTTDPTPGNNTGTATTTVQTRADLAVTKTDSPDPVIAGNNLTYTINFVNNGPSDAQTVTVTDAVPANTTFVSATVTTGTGWTTTAPAVGGTGNVVFSKATVTAGETAVFTMVVKVNSNTANGATITNSVTAATATTDPTAGNNTATATTTVQTQADLAVTKTDSPDPVIASQNLTYTINLVNNGPSDAQTVSVSDTLPANTTFVSATVTTGSGWTKTQPAVGGTGTVTFTKATVAAGETAVFTIVVNVNANTPHNTIITNSATATTATTDPTPGNNTGTATTTVIAQADLAVTKTDSPDPVCVNGNITYTINFVDNGPGPGINTTVTDPIPANTTFVSATVTTGTGWTTTAPAVGGTGNVVFSKANVVAGETAVFQMVVKVNTGTLHGTVISNTVTAASSIPDPTLGNNSATTTTTVDPIAPTIACPANITAVAALTCPASTTATVTFAPTVTDNCSASVVCAPASGTAFPVGTTTVTCTATDTAGNTASCSFTVTVFSGCLQDESNPSNVMLFDLQTGKYQFCCNGVVIATGTGTVNVRGCIVSIQHNKGDRRVQMSADLSQKRGVATVNIVGQLTCQINDLNMTNNNCMCPLPTH